MDLKYSGSSIIKWVHRFGSLVLPNGLHFLALQVSYHLRDSSFQATSKFAANDKRGPKLT